MKKSSGKKTVIIGCGNVAWHIAAHLQQKQHTLFVYNHQSNPKLKAFKKNLGCLTFTSLDNIIDNADYYFICVADKAISACATKIKISNSKALLLHTSGCSALAELGTQHTNRAVFYPLQTFSRKDNINWSELPLLIEASDKETEKRLKHLAATFSNTVVKMEEAQRFKMHLAAVLVNNFTNCLYAAASELTGSDKGQKDYFRLLYPIMEQTLHKVKKMPAIKAQTGPAKRGDSRILKKHLLILEGRSQLKKTYQQLTALIQQQNKE
jgi:predicted short-subunit dehydrogenase-like oxidoreductase (DUF2520 family)